MHRGTVNLHHRMLSEAPRQIRPTRTVGFRSGGDQARTANAVSNPNNAETRTAEHVIDVESLTSCVTATRSIFPR